MIKNRMIALGLAGALAVGAAATASAGPLPVNPGVTNATTDHVTDVRWRGHRGGWGWGGPALGIGAGLAAGALIGSAVAGGPYGYYYDEPGYVYGAPYAYDVGPTYYGYGGYGYRGWRGDYYCQEGYRRVPCTRY
jgi:hypothetical protein